MRPLGSEFATVGVHVPTPSPWKPFSSLLLGRQGAGSENEKTLGTQDVVCPSGLTVDWKEFMGVWLEK